MSIKKQLKSEELRKEVLERFRDQKLLTDTFQIINSVKDRGESEIIEYYKEKGIKRNLIRVSYKEMCDALDRVQKKDIVIFKNLKRRAERIARKEKLGFEKDILLNDDKNFKSVIINRPFETVGIYIPENLPSSLVFYCSLAKIAGVKNIILTLPPEDDGRINPYLLAAASLFDIKNIIAVGGRRAFPALAFGLGGLVPNKVFGPCSMYVDHVKQILNTFYKIPIDIASGPSELLTYIDTIDDIDQVKFDIRAQMEHGSDSRCFILSNNSNILSSISNDLKDIETQIQYLLVKDIYQTVGIINDIAPEILEVFSARPERIVEKLTNIANVYVNVPSPMGDYLAFGKGCADPTYGMAKGVSGITIGSFYKTSCVTFGKKTRDKKLQWITELPKIEKFEFHKKSIEEYLS